MEIEKIIRAAHACGISISREQAVLLGDYYQFLQKENKKYNLTRICDEEAVLYDHFIDSLWSAAASGGCTPKELLDLGSGAGFPGVPLKLYCPTLKLTLLETSQKKHDFLQQLTVFLNLKEVVLMKMRAEELGRGEKRESYEWVVARAVAPLPVLAELALPLLHIGGYFWAFKGPSPENELKEARVIVNRCGGVLQEIMSYTLAPGRKKRNVLVFEKMRETESLFPRRAGVPQKRPILK